MKQTKVKREPALRRRTLLLSATVAAVLLIAVVVVLVQDRDDAPATAQGPLAGHAPANAPGLSGVNIAWRFLDAYGAFDVDGMETYLADDAKIESLLGYVHLHGDLGAQDDPRLLVAFLEATGYRQFIDSCGQTTNGNGRDPGPVLCTFRFHALRSAELGRGPFGGGARVWQRARFTFAVSDGKIVNVSQTWAIKEFSPQVWEPFARWVSKTHPEDAAVMYTDESHTGVRLSEESIRLWERNTRAYVDEVKRSD
jgi:hypothetical protein